MAIFAVLAPIATPALTEAVLREFPTDYYEIAPGQFLVSAPNATTQDVGKRIGDKGEVGQVLFLPLSNWWGWHRKDLWEWLAAKSGP